MEAGDVVWLLVILFWIFSSVASWIGKNLRGKKTAERPAPPPPAPVPGRSAARPVPVRPGVPRPPAAPPRAPSPQDALTDLLKRIGVDVDPYAAEQPVPGEHRRTSGEHTHTPGWHQPTASEHVHTPGWHQQTASEVRPTASEQVVVPSEHRLTASEHRPGDVRRSGVPAAPKPAAAAAGFGSRMIADLQGSDSLARAIVLKEILGPPVGLRSKGDRPFEQ